MVVEHLYMKKHQQLRMMELKRKKLIFFFIKISLLLVSSWYQEFPSGNIFLSDVIKEKRSAVCQLVPTSTISSPWVPGDTPWWCPTSAVLETEWVVEVPPGSDWRLTDKNHEFWGRIWEVSQLNNKSPSQRAAVIFQIQHFYWTIGVFYRKIFLSHMKY